jgi:hypothetical protein
MPSPSTYNYLHVDKNSRVNVHNLAQAANWRSLVKTSLELQSCHLISVCTKITDYNKKYVFIFKLMCTIWRRLQIGAVW